MGRRMVLISGTVWSSPSPVAVPESQSGLLMAGSTVPFICHVSMSRETAALIHP